MIICPRYLHLITLGNVSPFSTKFRKPFTTKYHNVTVCTIVCSNPYSQHTGDNIDKTKDEEAKSSGSSVDIIWLINMEPIIHLALTLFNLLLRISILTPPKKVKESFLDALTIISVVTSSKLTSPLFICLNYSQLLIKCIHPLTLSKPFWWCFYE